MKAILPLLYQLLFITGATLMVPGCAITQTKSPTITDVIEHASAVDCRIKSIHIGELQRSLSCKTSED